MRKKFYLPCKRKPLVNYFTSGLSRKKTRSLLIIVVMLLFLPGANYGQVPTLGTAANFVLFTTNGAVGNTGVSNIKGNIGADVGAITGFGAPNIVNGTIHNADAITAQCVADLQAAYDQLSAIPANNTTHAPAFGTGETLFAGVYSIAGAGSVAGTLILDAQGDPNALFIFKIAGAFTTGASSTIILANGASPCNVFWVAEGAISMATFTTMKGTLIAHPGAVSMGAGCNLEGRMFSTTGAVSVYGVTAVIGCSGTTSWTGAAGTADWFTTGNWDNGIPDKTVEASIPATLLAGRVFPIIDSGIAIIDSLIIQSAATLIVTNSTLQINGAINTMGTLNAGNGTIEMIGHSGQAIAANTFQSDSVKNLIISNNSMGGVVLGGALDIYGSLTYSGTGMKLTTNDTLTLKSTALNTARVGDMTGNTITGKVTVERYIAAHKAWQLLSVPTHSIQTVKQSWQEGATGTSSDPAAGFGTQITSDRSGWAADGFDLYSAAPSMKKYNSVANTWEGISTTNADSIKAIDGYMVFIRGDRMANTFISPSTETVMRTKGSLFTGDQDSILVNAGKFASIGNPFASQLDMRLITKTGLKDFFYLWDPQLGGSSGFGAYQTFSNNGAGDYEITPGEGSYDVGGSVSNYIRSGFAFLIQADSVGGRLIFKEAAKSSGIGQVSSVAGLLRTQLRIGLYGVNSDNSNYIIDGVLGNYDDSYNNLVDGMDAVKSANTSENLAIRTGNTFLVIERRQSIAETDTIFLNLANTRIQQYRFKFAATHLGEEGLIGFLEDAYLHTSTPLYLNGNTNVDFNIANIPGSYRPDRFRIVFRQLSTLPVTFTSIKASQKNKDIAVEWRVENESSLKQYDVEKSVDGIRYAIANTVKTHNPALNNYSWLDIQPSEGYNYYRIRSTDINGKTIYSTVVKVYMNSIKQTISVYPNPVINDIINLQFTNEAAGIYGIRLLNETGQVIVSKQISHAEGSNTETIRLDKNSAHGIYQLEITRPDRNKVNINVIY